MKNRDEFESRWSDWSRSEPALDEDRLRKNLLDRIPDRRSRLRTPFILAAAAASVVAILIGVESSRQPVLPPVAESPEVVYETGDNVILVLREGADPIYVVTESSNPDVGE